MVGEYTDGTMYSSTDGGHTFADYVSPTCVGPGHARDDAAAGLRPGRPVRDAAGQDQQNTNVWVTGGQYVWVTKDGWNTSCTDTACSWQPVYNTGAGNAVTALSSANSGRSSTPRGSAAAATPGRPSPPASPPTTAAPGTRSTRRAARPLHRRRHRRPERPGACLRHLQRLLAAVRTRRRRRSRVRDLQRRPVVDRHLRQPSRHRLRRAGPEPRQAGAGHRPGRLHGAGGPGHQHPVVPAGHRACPTRPWTTSRSVPTAYIYAATHGRGVWRIRF